MADRRTGQFASQASWLVAGRVAAAGTSAVWFVVLARSIPLDEFGSLALLLSVGLMMSIITDLGLTGLLANLVAERPAAARPAARVIVEKRLLLAGLSSLLTGLAYVAAGGEGRWTVPALFAVSTFASAVYSTYTAAFRAMGHAGYEGANEALSRLVLLAVGVVVVVGAGGGLLAVVAVYVVVDLLSLIVLAVVFFTTADAPCSLEDAPPLGLREARSLAAAGIVSTFYFRIDAWLLALFKGNQVVGRYAAAYRCFDALLLPALAITSLSIPHTAGLEGRELRDRLLSFSAFSVVITAPFSLTVFLGAQPLVRILFGAQYAPAATPLRILAIGALCTAPTSAILPRLALRSGRVARALAVNLVLNVVANLLVIPGYGAAGAAAVTVGCELLLLAWVALEVGRLGAGQPVLQPS